MRDTVVQSQYRYQNKSPTGAAIQHPECAVRLTVGIARPCLLCTFPTPHFERSCSNDHSDALLAPAGRRWLVPALLQGIAWVPIVAAGAKSL